jgi:hypothetical protein
MPAAMTPVIIRFRSKEKSMIASGSFVIALSVG